MSVENVTGWSIQSLGRCGSMVGMGKRARQRLVRARQYLRAKLGRRGAMLLILGITYLVIGYGVGTRVMPPVRGSFITYADQLLLAVAWALTGAVAVVHSWRRWDALGWLALYLMPGLYVLSYGGAWLMWVVTADVLPWVAWFVDYVLPPPFTASDWLIDPPFGDPSAWYNAVLRVPFIATVLVCSGWHENRERTPRT